MGALPDGMKHSGLLGTVATILAGDCAGSPGEGDGFAEAEDSCREEIEELEELLACMVFLLFF